MSALDAARRELTRKGRLRAAINYGNPVLAQKDARTGAPVGVSVELATELARRLNVSLELVTYDAAGRVVDAAGRDEWDVAFLAIDPLRAETIAFTEPYMVIEGTYLVHDMSPFQATSDLDRAGVRIAVGTGAAYDLYLTRNIRTATLVRAETSAGAVELFLAGGADAAAGVRQPLAAATRSQGGLRLLEDSFTAIRQAVACPRSRGAALPYLQQYVAEVTQSGPIAEAIATVGHA